MEDQELQGHTVRSATGGIGWYMMGVAPSQDSSDHQDSYIFSRGLLETFIYHYYWEGATPKWYFIHGFDFLFACLIVEKTYQ